MGYLYQAASATAGLKGKLKRSVMLGSRRNRSSVFAWACSWQRLNTPAMCWGMLTHILPEFVPDTKHPIIDLLPEQKDVEDMGGTLRLGLYPCRLVSGTKAFEAYEENVVYERHRHRYEFNNEYRQEMEEAGFVFSGTSPDGRLVEIIEIKDHPWFVASQFHPEFVSRPTRPQALFRDFIKASLQK